MGEIFTLESETETYQEYSWELEWAGTSFRQALEERDILLDKYTGAYDKFRITVWIDGKVSQRFYYDKRKEIMEGDL
jgi:hypothetical protein